VGCTKVLGQVISYREVESMSQARRRFSHQFKAEAVQLVVQTGRPIAEIARELQVNEGTLGNWVNTWRRENPEPEPELTPVERAKVKMMEDEIRRLRLENEFLKKAAAFFAKTQP
jgi:transposase-like protein